MTKKKADAEVEKSELESMDESELLQEEPIPEPFVDQKYGVFDTHGLPVTFYSTAIHGETIPADAVPLTDEQWSEFINNNGMRKLVAGNIEEYTPPPPAPSAVLVRQIATLESQQTPRRLREAVLGTDGGFLKSIDEQIKALRIELANLG